MSEIEDVLSEVVTLVKTMTVTNPPGGRVWAHPNETASIDFASLPVVIVSKLNAEPGAWIADSFGAGRHDWKVLIAVFVEEGPVVVTNKDDLTIRAMKNASEWYQAMATLLYENMTLNGQVDIIGDGDGMLFEYVTDNIIWDGKQYFGHLFMIPVTQKVIQGVSA